MLLCFKFSSMSRRCTMHRTSLWFLMSCCLLGANTIGKSKKTSVTYLTVAAMVLHHYSAPRVICPNTSGKALIWNPKSSIFLPGTGNTDCIPMPVPWQSAMIKMPRPPTYRIGTTTPHSKTKSTKRTFTRSQDLIRSRRKLLLCRLSIEILWWLCLRRRWLRRK